jgi:hypothetical protein
MNPNDSLNEKSKELYDKLIAADVEIELSIDADAPTWYVRTKRSFKIGSPDGAPNKAGMAHELLHINLAMRGFDDVLGIYKYHNEQNSLFDPDFIAALNNSLAHYKMIDDFIDLGFSVDEFLQDTPKKYFIDSILLSIIGMQVAHKAGTTKICDQTKSIIQFCTSAKLFNLYKEKDPTTKNGVSDVVILEQLKEIDKPLVEGLEQILDEWINTESIDNLGFYNRLNALLKRLNIPNSVDCP